MRLTLTIESPTLTMAKNMGVHKKTDLKSVFSLVINDLRLSLAEEVSVAGFTSSSLTKTKNATYINGLGVIRSPCMVSRNILESQSRLWMHLGVPWLGGENLR